MNEHDRKSSLYSRREFGKLALTAVPAAGWLTKSNDFLAAGARAAKLDSMIGGVRIGVIAPYSFHNMPSDAESLLKDMVELGIGACELQSPPAESFAGAPTARGEGAGPGGGSGRSGPGGSQGPAPAGRGGGRAALTPEQLAAQQAAARGLKTWRLSVSMDKFKALRKLYNDAGVQIYGFKLGLTPEMSDDEYEYTFNVAEALGAEQLTMELPGDGRLTRRIGEFAARRKMMVGYHAHTQATLTMWDEAISQSKYNGVNLDIGHYVAGTSQSPIPMIRKHHDRITSMHLKDRKINEGPNMPWGRGDTPIKEVLGLMKKERYKFPATIELEYDPPPGSDTMKEIARCLQYCKDALADGGTGPV
jgi:sugar phosphate isomerase/epimerase